MKLCIYIPARNVEKTLASVIDRIPDSIKRSAVEILIVDNRSRDRTYEIAINYKKKSKNISVIRNKRDMNYGGSQKIAYSRVIKKNYDIVVMLHGDAQYPPEKIPDMIRPIIRGEADLVLGSRMKGAPLKGRMPLWRFAGNKSLTFLENLVLGTNLSEFHTGFRAFRVSALRKISFMMNENNYNFDSDIIIQFVVNNYRVKDIVIPTHYGRESKSPSVFETAKYSLNIVATMLKYILHKYSIRKIKKFEQSR